MTGISIDLNDEAVLAQLQRLKQGAEDMRPIMSAIGAALVTSTQRRFERETGPDGQKWTPLRPRTAAARIGRGRTRGTANILRVSGRLSQSITSETTDSETRVGTNVIYAAIQQLGGSIDREEREQTIFQNYDAKTDKFDAKFRAKHRSNFSRTVKVGAHKVTLPARPYLGIDQADRETITNIVNDHFAEAAQ